MAATATVVESVHLSYRDGSSDKEYHIYLCDHGGLYSVHAEYGRRGSVSQRAEKGMFGSRFGARDEFAKLESQKRGKGYDSMMGTRPPKNIPLGARPAPAPAPAAPVFDAALVAFNDKLKDYVTAMSSDELSAGRTATARLATDMGVSKSKVIATLPSYQPMVAMLGAIAFASQDYTDDAVELGTELLRSKTVSRKNSEKAVALMPPTLAKVLDDVLIEYPRSDGVAGLVKHLFQTGRDTWFA
jgi:predicted DNA-binding WGR domain protein